MLGENLPPAQQRNFGFGLPHLGEQFAAMNSLHLLADASFFGLSVNAWKIVGWTGNIIFGARFIIQWIASERARKSVIPVGFWECSALGSVLLLTYFAFYRRDSVGVLSALFPLPIYLRNLYFRYVHHAAVHPGNEPRVEE
ncbi:MAG TPA: lipid-A-disaccharide synthase N-terminal domain-containing protein [Chthoniobacterales bacterium]|jgi:lipid-A-disaccharide synthase-like uncharacterized protein|nr:lipid-A-disaccharide synthase N-terminal domain-containing protein [Chthoniobacterales bacterium]